MHINTYEKIVENRECHSLGNPKTDIHISILYLDRYIHRSVLITNNFK